MRHFFIIFVTVFLANGAYALDVGDPHPGLDGDTIDDSDNYLGPFLDIQDYLDDGKFVVVSHWAQS